MTPIYRISLDGDDITGNFNDRMLDITVVEHDGHEGDTLDITLDDRDSALEIPPKGRSLEIFMGYTETGIESLGVYIIETIRLSWAPFRTMSIHGKSADLKDPSLKEHRNVNYENMSVMDIASQVAARSGLTPQINGDIGLSTFKMLHQTDESDMNFMTRLAKDHDALFKVAGGSLIVAKRGESTSPSGELISVTITPGLVSAAIVSLPDRSEFGTATAYSYDFTNAARVPADGGGGGDGAFNLKHLLLDADKATSAATARVADLERARADAHVELALGDPQVTPSGTMTLTGFRDGMDGDYTITSVEHRFDSSGYVTKIDGDNGASTENDGNTNNFNPRDSGLIPKAANAIRAK